jgi:hypothetical protein
MSGDSPRKAVRPLTIVSGGQTGVDRGALDAAIALGIPHGGWCPRGRLAEDGAIPSRYKLTETDSPDYSIRTERNVLDSDATLILYRGELRGGTELTRQLAERHGKHCLVVDLDRPPHADEIRQWIVDIQPGTLNVAGPRESQSPGICARTTELLKRLFAQSEV